MALIAFCPADWCSLTQNAPTLSNTIFEMGRGGSPCIRGSTGCGETSRLKMGKGVIPPHGDGMGPARPQ